MSKVGLGKEVGPGEEGPGEEAQSVAELKKQLKELKIELEDREKEHLQNKLNLFQNFQQAVLENSFLKQLVSGMLSSNDIKNLEIKTSYNEL